MKVTRTRLLVHYQDAEIYFENSRSIRSIPEEHGYVTNIDLISYRLEDQTLDIKKTDPINRSEKWPHI